MIICECKYIYIYIYIFVCEYIMGLQCFYMYLGVSIMGVCYMILDVLIMANLI